MDLQRNVLYKIPCWDCSWNYIGETGRCFQTRKKEHKRNLKNYAKDSNIANHAWSSNHLIDFENARVIDKGNYRVRKTLESWHLNADNNSKPLPWQYSILLWLFIIFNSLSVFTHFLLHIFYCLLVFFAHLLLIFVIFAFHFSVRQRLQTGSRKLTVLNLFN